MTSRTGCLWLLAALACNVPFLAADIKIVTRYSAANGAHKSVSTRYIQGQRSRLQYGEVGAQIFQCDLRKAIDLNLPGRIFYAVDLDPEGFPVRQSVTNKPPKRALPPTTEYTIISKETGKRATIFGLPAWHVQVSMAARMIRTGTTSHYSIDYWFVDLKVPNGCHDLPQGMEAFISANPELFKVKHIGTARRGFPMLARTVQIADGRPVESVTEVTELSFSQLDPQLFEVPKDFKSALQIGDQVYMNQADTPGNRMAAGWRRFWEGAAKFLP
jgi:hypothetical protein